MPHRKHKHLTRNIILAAAVIAVILVSTFASFYFGGLKSQKPQPTPPPTSHMLAVGDNFTYALSGTTVLGSSDTVTPKEFLQYNGTDYYQVTVKAIEGSKVTLETTWQFKNGTQVKNPQVIDLSTGAVGQLAVFSYLYPANLNLNDPLYPEETSGLVVNSTGTQNFAGSTRATNIWSTTDEFVNTGDTTGNTMRFDYISVTFDRQTGMLDGLTRIQFFTSPEIQLTTTWKLTSSNVWTVK